MSLIIDSSRLGVSTHKVIYLFHYCAILIDNSVFIARMKLYKPA